MPDCFFSIKDRDYLALARAVAIPANAGRERRMQLAADALWDALRPTGVSWIGFYTARPGDDQMLLGPRRDKPACSPIGMHGACGRAFQSRRGLVVTDVKHLGENYVACDPRDLAEVVIPLFEPDGTPWGVLAADSWERSAFREEDALGLMTLMEAWGLSARRGELLDVDVV